MHAINTLSWLLELQGGKVGITRNFSYLQNHLE